MWGDKAKVQAFKNGKKSSARIARKYAEQTHKNRSAGAKKAAATRKARKAIDDDLGYFGRLGK